MRAMCLMIATSFGSILAAETIENVEFQLPPSTNEWVLLTDTRTFDEDASYIKVYTHRVGDALEFFTTGYSPYDPSDEEVDQDDDDDEDSDLDLNDDDDDDFDLALENVFKAPGLAQAYMNDFLKPYFPNHRIALTYAKDTEDESCLGWEIDDGFQPVVYGLTRVLKKDGNEVLLSYMTTAMKKEQNVALWAETLSRANWIN